MTPCSSWLLETQRGHRDGQAITQYEGSVFAVNANMSCHMGCRHELCRYPGTLSTWSPVHKRT